MSDNRTSIKDVVAVFLRSNPDFLKEFPDLLATLNISHSTGAASSLIERQVKQLRSQNHELNRQLNRLMHVAAENEQLMSRLHQFTLELLAITQPAAFFKHLKERLKEDFKADIARIFLFDGELASMAGSHVSWLAWDDDKTRMFQPQLSQNLTVCGRLNESKLAVLFESKAQWVKSTALIPIGAGGHDGMLAIGSSDNTRFYPGMGTLFLDLLADVIASSLAKIQPEEKRLTA